MPVQGALVYESRQGAGSVEQETSRPGLVSLVRQTVHQAVGVDPWRNVYLFGLILTGALFLLLGKIRVLAATTQIGAKYTSALGGFLFKFLLALTLGMGGASGATF